MNNKTKYNPNIHHRRSIRLKEYDYSQAGLYFITICCQDRICRFGHVENDEMILNQYGQIAFDEWVRTIELRNNVELGEFVIMPNHMHGIIRLFDRGELNSPQTELNAPQTELNTFQTELNAPQTELNAFQTELNAPKTELNTFQTELNAPQTELNSPKTELNSPQTELNAPKTELNTTENKMDNNVEKMGELNAPLRGPSQTVGAIVRGYKSSVSRQLGLLGFDEKLWQRNYYEHIIRNEKSHKNISEYIINNPAKWKDDKFHSE
ncbi:MAG TPA: hypothetical protein VLZ83_06800 [Edaphocola sp.]|nr:hypothetical protein [Edaphocola sp.]